MEVFWNLKDVERNDQAVLTVGTFDGVHLGHRFVLRELCRRAKALNTSSTLVTFDPHPQLVLAPAKKPRLRMLTDVKEKISLLGEEDLSRLVIVEFTPELAKTPADVFVKEYLYERIGFREIIIGYDHAFGHNRSGGVSTLQSLGEQLDFTVTELSEVKNERHRLKSTAIRELLSKGDVRGAAAALGRRYSLRGTVVEGAGRGRELGFATANLRLESEHKLLPMNGVYAVRARLRGRSLNGMMNIGSRPTFEDTQTVVEVHIFDFSDSIYTEEVHIEFISRIRDEIAFPNKEQLVRQLSRDKIETLSVLNEETLKEAKWH